MSDELQAEPRAGDKMTALQWLADNLPLWIERMGADEAARATLAINGEPVRAVSLTVHTPLARRIPRAGGPIKIERNSGAGFTLEITTNGQAPRAAPPEITIDERGF